MSNCQHLQRIAELESQLASVKAIAEAAPVPENWAPHSVHEKSAIDYGKWLMALEIKKVLNIQPAALEPYGGNLYRPHPLMVNSGQFWRCAHGSTGLGVGMDWFGCSQCEKNDPKAFARFNSPKP